MLKNTFLFSLGALCYGLVELAWRGHTHWSMLLLGGLCFVYLYQLSERALPLLLQALLGAMGITFLELCTGLLCNEVFDMAVWDYSREWGNFHGQICPKYSILWFLLCLPIFAVLRRCRMQNTEYR